MRAADGDGYLLLVDDHADAREALAELLRLHGLPVLTVEHGDAALAAAAGPHRLLAVVLDLVMPGTSGTDLLRQLKRDPRMVAVPIVVLTGLSVAEREARAAGCDAFLLKPVNLQTLLAALARFGISVEPARRTW